MRWVFPSFVFSIHSFIWGAGGSHITYYFANIRFNYGLLSPTPAATTQLQIDIYTYMYVYTNLHKCMCINMSIRQRCHLYASMLTQTTCHAVHLLDVNAPIQMFIFPPAVWQLREFVGTGGFSAVCIHTYNTYIHVL